MDTDSKSYTLELLLRPSNIESLSTILAFYNPTASKQLLVRQLKSGVGITQDSDSERGRIINCHISHVFVPGRLLFIGISSGANGITFYVDGKRSYSFPGSTISRGDLSGYIVLGTSPVTDQSWNGEMRGLALYSKALTDEEAFQHYQAWLYPDDHHPDLDDALYRYTFSEGTGRTINNQVISEPNLEIPTTYAVLHKAFLRSPQEEFRPDWRYVLDVLSNIAGFIPLGLMLCTYLDWTKAPWKAVLLTVFFCGIFSCMIEIAQFFIPGRGSGTTDIITNTFGGALGAALSQISAMRRLSQRMKLARTEA